MALDLWPQTHEHPLLSGDLPPEWATVRIAKPAFTCLEARGLGEPRDADVVKVQDPLTRDHTVRPCTPTPYQHCEW